MESTRGHPRGKCCGARHGAAERWRFRTRSQGETMIRRDLIGISLTTLSLTALTLTTACAGSPAITTSSGPAPAAGATLLTRATMARQIDSMVNDRQFRSATWGIL